jgi:two-component system sensor histidine kinase ChvG
VPDALRSKIFRRFFATDEARDGTGLGLAIAGSVAHSHGGRLELEPCDGPGACFVLRLAIASRHAA